VLLDPGGHFAASVGQLGAGAAPMGALRPACAGSLALVRRRAWARCPGRGAAPNSLRAAT